MGTVVIGGNQCEIADAVADVNSEHRVECAANCIDYDGSRCWCLPCVPNRTPSSPGVRRFTRFTGCATIRAKYAATKTRNRLCSNKHVVSSQYLQFERNQRCFAQRTDRTHRIVAFSADLDIREYKCRICGVWDNSTIETPLDIGQRETIHRDGENKVRAAHYRSIGIARENARVPSHVRSECNRALTPSSSRYSRNIS